MSRLGRVCEVLEKGCESGGSEVRGVCWKGCTKDPLRPLPVVVTDACEAPLVDRACEYFSAGFAFLRLETESEAFIPEGV